jgi:hypothetical protein
MARITLVSGTERDIPDESLTTERGIEWADDDGKHVVPWSAVSEFVGPTPDAR